MRSIGRNLEGLVPAIRKKWLEFPNKRTRQGGNCLADGLLCVFLCFFVMSLSLSLSLSLCLAVCLSLSRSISIWWIPFFSHSTFGGKPSNSLSTRGKSSSRVAQPSAPRSHIPNISQSKCGWKGAPQGKHLPSATRVN